MIWPQRQYYILNTLALWRFWHFLIFVENFHHSFAGISLTKRIKIEGIDPRGTKCLGVYFFTWKMFRTVVIYDNAIYERENKNSIVSRETIICQSAIIFNFKVKK